MARPLAKVMFKEKGTNNKFEIGVIWPAREGQESFGPTLQVHAESAENGKYTPQMAYIDALERNNAKEGFINILVTDPGLKAFLGMEEFSPGGGKVGAPLPEDDF